MSQFSVRVFHNVGDGRFWEWKPGASMEQVFQLEVEADSPESACEVVYAILNSYIGEMFCDREYAPVVQRYREQRNRSLSMGDLVIIDGQAFACLTMGWEKVTYEV